MSYIDCFDSEFVGFFGGIAVYHPLEIVPALPNEDPRDFACGPENLVIGGGSGEHPGIVVKVPGDTVPYFVREWLEKSPFLSPEKRHAIEPSVEAWPDFPKQHGPGCGLEGIIEFAGWRADEYEQFTNHCTSTAFHCPFDPDEDESLEHWLAASVGEFILMAMPELAQEAIQRLGELRRHITEALYKNILLLPPGYPVWGRREVDNQVTWGISAWRIRREQYPRTIR